MTQNPIPATAVFFWVLYGTIFTLLPFSWPDFGILAIFVFGEDNRGRGRNFAIFAFAKPGKWHKILYQPQQYFSGYYMAPFSGRSGSGSDFGHFRDLGKSWEVFGIRIRFLVIFGPVPPRTRQKRQQHPFFRFWKFNTGFTQFPRFCSSKPNLTWKWLYVRRTKPILA